MISRRVQPAKLIIMLAQYMNVVLNKETKSFEKNNQNEILEIKKCCKPNIKYHGNPNQQHHSGGEKC